MRLARRPTLLLALVVAVSGWSAVAVRGVLDARRAGLRLTVAGAQGDRVQEIVELGRMIRAYPITRRPSFDASQTLSELAAAAERDGDRPRALEAWRELRSAWLAVRGISDPGHAWIDRAESEMTRLGAAREASIQPHLAAPGLSVLAALALLAWAAAAVGLIWYGLDSSGRLRPRAATPWLLALGAGLVVWVAALLKA